MAAWVPTSAPVIEEAGSSRTAPQRSLPRSPDPCGEDERWRTEACKAASMAHGAMETPFNPKLRVKSKLSCSLDQSHAFILRHVVTFPPAESGVK